MNRKSLHPWAQIYSDLLIDIEKTVASLDAKDARSLRRVVKRLGKTNCWFALYALRDFIIPALDRRARIARTMKRKRNR